MKLVYTPLTPVGVSLEVEVMCPIRRTLGTCNWK